MFQTSSEYEPKIRTFWSESFLQGCHNCHQRVQRKSFRKNLFSKIDFVFFVSFGLLANFSRLLAKKLSWCVETAINVYRGKLWETLTVNNRAFCNCRTTSRHTWTCSGKKWHDPQNCSIRVRAKKLPQKCFWRADFSSTLNVDQDELELTGKILAGKSILNCVCPEEHLQSKVFERKCWKIQVFRMGIEVYGTVARKFFRFAKTVIIVQRNKLRKILSYKTKLAVRWRFWVNFFYFQRKSSPELSKLQPTRPWNILRKNIDWYFAQCCKILRFFSQRNNV